MATGDTGQETGYKKLIVWQVAGELAHSVYDLTLSFPKDEQFAFTPQLRRAIISVAANIIEGYGRYSKNEFHHFLSIALGSLSEVEYYLEFSFKRKYINQAQFNQVAEVRDRCGKMLWKLYKSQAK